MLEELVSTEENYVEDLHSVLFGYRDRLEECEERIRQKSEDIFGNLEEIYDFHSQVRTLNTEHHSGLTGNVSVFVARPGALRGGHQEAGQDFPGVQQPLEEDLLQVGPGPQSPH